MNFFLTLFNTSLGKKYLMAITGVLLCLFVLGHMAGNMALFAGQNAINDYAAFLKSKTALLWGARLGLLGTVAVHIWAAITLSQMNKAARPVGYYDATPPKAKAGSTWMLAAGLTVLAFIIIHILHFTVGAVMSDAYSMKQTLDDGTVRHDVYGMVVAGFQNPVMALFYLGAMAVLCFFHLKHGVSSLFQSLGLRHPKWASTIDFIAVLFAWVIFLGNAAIVLSVLLGIVK